jgi:hypothetical protein
MGGHSHPVDDQTAAFLLLVGGIRRGSDNNYGKDAARRIGGPRYLLPCSLFPALRPAPSSNAREPRTAKARAMFL